MILHLYIGLPGSGKTYLATKHKAKLGGILIDDINKLSDLYQAMEDCSRSNNENIFITDPNLCFKSNRDSLKTILNPYTNIQIHRIPDKISHINWIFFENNPQRCWENIKLRNDGRIITYQSIKLYSNNYTIPNDITPIKIWKKNKI